MALNIAVPLSGLGGLSPNSPIGIDCWENIKILVSPIGSESSGVSSLDSEDAKQQVKPTPPRKPEAIKQDLRIYYNGRNVLDLYNNVETNSTTWKFRYSHLPEKNNISMFWANRSLYNRLGPNGLTPVYTINKCECCDFQYTSDCPNSYLSDTSLNMSSTTTSPMIFTTASTKKPEYHTTKVTSVSAHLTSNATPAINQQSLTGYKSSFELSNKQFCNQNNLNKTKNNDIFFKKTNNLTNINTNNYNNNNNNKFNNLIGSGKTTTDLSQLASALVAVNVSNSPSNTPPPNVMMGYSTNAIHQNGYNESKCNVPQNFFNSLSSTQSVSNNFHNSHVNTNNSVLLNNTTNNASNKTQITSSSNNLYSLFNSSNTNNSAMYAFNPNGNNNNNNNTNSNNNNNNTYMNSFNAMSTNNNINSNPLTTVTSQQYGRMYKYF